MVMQEAWLSEVKERAALALEMIDDPEVCRRYVAEAARHDVPRLIKLVEAMAIARGGDLGMRLKEAIADSLLAAGQGKVAIAGHCDVQSLSAKLSQGSVIVDVRLEVKP